MNSQRNHGDKRSGQLQYRPEEINNYHQETLKYPCRDKDLTINNALRNPEPQTMSFDKFPRLEWNLPERKQIYKDNFCPRVEQSLLHGLPTVPKSSKANMIHNKFVLEVK